MAAAANGHEEFLRQMYWNDPDAARVKDYANATEAAVEKGHVEVARTIFALFQRRGSGALNIAEAAAKAAARTGNLNVLNEFLNIVELSPAAKASIFQSAAANNQLAIMEWMDSSPFRAKDIKNALADAVGNGHQQVYAYLQQTRPDWYRHADVAYKQAVRHGRSDMEEDLRPFIGHMGLLEAMMEAVALGDPDVVDTHFDRYRQAGHFWHASQLDQYHEHAVNAGHWEVLQHLVRRYGAPQSAQSVNKLAWRAVAGQQPRMMAKLLQHGVGGIMPDNVGDVFTIAFRTDLTAQAILLALAKNPQYIDTLIDSIDMFDRGTFVAAVPGAVEIARQEGFTPAEVNVIHDFLAELNSQ